MKKSRNLVSNLLRIGISPPKGQRGRKLGKAPGTVTYLGNREDVITTVNSLVYDDEDLVKSTVENMKVLSSPPGRGKTQWINVVGLSDESRMKEIGQESALNALVVEDIVNTEGRPKVDEYEDYIFIVLKMLNPNGEGKILKEHVALVLRPGQVFLYQEIEADVFDGVRSRIEQHSGRIRSRGADYLFFALIDAIVDHYYVILDHVGRRLEEMEESIDDHPDAGLLDEIHAVRRELIYLRKQVWPLRDIISLLLKEESSFFSDTTRLFIRDVYDHTIQTIDTIESFRDILSGLQDLYLSIISNRMNEVMKVLTVIATIFIPVTFVAGIYGMNFQHMPELGWCWGYPLFWIVTIVIVAGMLFFFRKRRWL